MNASACVANLDQQTVSAPAATPSAAPANATLNTAVDPPAQAAARARSDTSANTPSNDPAGTPSNTQSNTPALTRLTLDELEHEIGLLASHLNAATFRLLEFIAELDRREPWGAFGCKTGAHYLNWKCGIALGAAREKIRTARALRDLPAISAAFRRGQISYSKARAITRVATPANEVALLDIAQAGTATHVERIVRYYRQIHEPTDLAEMLERRELSTHWDDDGSLVFRGRLNPDQGAAFVQAINQARSRPAPGQPAELFATSAADALVAISESFLAGGGPNNHSFDNRTADRYQVKVTIPLETLVQAQEKTPVQDDPGFKEALLQKRLARIRAQGGSPTPQFHGSAIQSDPASQPDSSPQSDSTLKTDPTPHPTSAFPAASAAVLEDGPPLALAIARRLCCDGSVIPLIEDKQGNPLQLGRKTRTVPPAMRRAIERRDGGCRFPGCTQTRHVDAHHVVHWADGGATDLSNLVSLCRRHHTLVHEGNYQVRPQPGAPQRFVFYTPYGWRMPATAEKRFNGNAAALRAQNEARGLGIHAETCEPSWDGKPADYDHIMFVLGQYSPGPVL